MIIDYRGAVPDTANAAFIADNATVSGAVVLGEGSSVWFGATIRAEVASISVGAASNIQDSATLHTDVDMPVVIGDRVTVGHNAVVHGATVEDDVLIGMHATVLNGAHIGRGSLIAAGALVKEHEVIPERSLVVGVPGKVIRAVDEQTYEHNVANAGVYVEEAREYARSSAAGQWGE